MVRKATGWVTGIRDRKGTSSPAGSTIGSGSGAGPKTGTSESFHPIGGGIDGTPADVPAAGASPEPAAGCELETTVDAADADTGKDGPEKDGAGTGEDETAAAAWPRAAGDRVAPHPATGNSTSTAQIAPS